MTKHSKATSEMLDMLHRLTAEQLASIIRDGLPIHCKETGDVLGYEPAPAAYISNAIKFLKDNDITADPNADRFDPLKDAMVDLPDLDEIEDEYVN